MNPTVLPPGAIPSLAEFLARRRIGLGLETPQEEAVRRLDAFLRDPAARVFVLRGGPGTGKTLLAGWVARYLRFQLKRRYRLAAPTLRAAATLGLETGEDGCTVHALLYDLAAPASWKGPDGPFCYPSRPPVPHDSDTVFIVDQAEMLDDACWAGEAHPFGSGRLLPDLVRYTRADEAGRATKLLLVGDDAPWPASGSRVLDPDRLEALHRLAVGSFSLPPCPPQARGPAGIEANQARVRRVLASGEPNHFEVDFSKGDVFPVSRGELCRRLVAGDETSPRGLRGVIVVRDDDEAREMNQAMRALLWGDGKAPLRRGDRVVMPCHYPLHGLTRGELLEVAHAAAEPEPHAVPLLARSLRFRRVTLRRLGPGPEPVVSCLVLESPGLEEGWAVASAVSRALQADFFRRHPDLEDSPVLPAAAATDPYLNAVRPAFGYAVTCLQAPGTRFDEVGVVFGAGRTDLMAEAFLRWAAAAMGRARRVLYVVDAPRFDPLSYLTRKRGDLDRAFTRHGPPPPPRSSADFLDAVLEARLAPWGISIFRLPDDDGGKSVAYRLGHGLARAEFRFHRDDQGFFRLATAASDDPRFASVTAMLAGEGAGR